ncbi:Uncharacterized protein TCM_001093 [Theobroma cacao]|uniref:Uncharacterized protein n=1 Tax=Theobroma cacao TaxID=3641 RepID=A0A061DJF8_THECC|nr:Uncharacterized protein TCM_001093 [Theobroma cacao]
MSVSIEALAMAGIDYLEWGMEIEEWELEDLEPPPHLLAEEAEEDIFQNNIKDSSSISHLIINLLTHIMVLVVCNECETIWLKNCEQGEMLERINNNDVRR